MRNAKYQVALIAHKNISGEVKDAAHKNSICNIKDIDGLNELLDDQSYYKGSGAWFDMNDRMDIYLGWYKDDIQEKLEENYQVDIIEMHKSYGDRNIEHLLDIEKKLENNLLVVDRELL